MKWRHLTNDLTITVKNDSSCFVTASQTEQNTYML